jgi:hypothetical protein
MSTIKFFVAVVFLMTGMAISTQAQDRTETRTERSSCFSGKITVTIQHATPGKKDGAISLNIPRSAGSTKVMWIGYEVGKEARKLERIAAGYYTIMIFDGNNCSTQIQKVQVKEVP